MSYLYLIYEPRREKTGFLHMRKQTQISFAVTAKLIGAFVFATRIVQSLYFLYTKLQASSHLLLLYSPVCVGPGRKPRRPVFSQRGSYSEWNMKAWAINFRLSGSFCCGVQNFDSFHRIFGVRGLVKKQTVLTTVCSLVFGRIGLGKQFRPRSDG